MENRIFLTTSQMAKLHKISKRQLQYYDDIGLFSPEEKSAANYRYYSYEQSSHLEMILSLAELGMKLDDIKNYISERTPKGLVLLLSTKKIELEEKINELQAIRNMLEQQILNLNAALSTETGTPYLEFHEEEILLATPTLCSGSMEEMYTKVSSTLIGSKARHLYCHITGGILSEESWRSGAFTSYSNIYFKTAPLLAPSLSLVKPAGQYLCFNCKGNWQELENAYSLLIEYALRNNILLSGSAYEDDLIEDFSEKDPSQFITKIMIRTI